MGWPTTIVATLEILLHQLIQWVHLSLMKLTSTNSRITRVCNVYLYRCSQYFRWSDCNVVYTISILSQIKWFSYNRHPIFFIQPYSFIQIGPYIHFSSKPSHKLCWMHSSLIHQKPQIPHLKHKIKWSEHFRNTNMRRDSESDQGYTLQIKTHLMVLRMDLDMGQDLKHLHTTVKMETDATNWSHVHMSMVRTWAYFIKRIDQIGRSTGYYHSHVQWKFGSE